MVASYTRKVAARRKPKSKRSKRVRVEVRVAKVDVELVRQLAKSLNDPGRVAKVRKEVAPLVREFRITDTSLTDGTYALDDEGERMWDEILAQGRREWNSFPERVIDLSD
jgi:hypothetical protein